MTSSPLGRVNWVYGMARGFASCPAAGPDRRTESETSGTRTKRTFTIGSAVEYAGGRRKLCRGQVLRLDDAGERDVCRLIQLTNVLAVRRFEETHTARFARDESASDVTNRLSLRRHLLAGLDRGLLGGRERFHRDAGKIAISHVNGHGNLLENESYQLTLRDEIRVSLF